MNKNNKSNIKKVYRFYTLIFVVFCIVFGRTLVYQAKEKNRLNNEIQLLEDKKNKLNHEIETAKSDIQNVESKEFIEKVAREKLKMIQKNEVIVKYRDDN